MPRYSTKSRAAIPIMVDAAWNPVNQIGHSLREKRACLPTKNRSTRLITMTETRQARKSSITPVTPVSIAANAMATSTGRSRRSPANHPVASAPKRNSQKASGPIKSLYRHRLGGHRALGRDPCRATKACFPQCRPALDERQFFGRSRNIRSACNNPGKTFSSIGQSILRSPDRQVRCLAHFDDARAKSGQCHDGGIHCIHRVCRIAGDYLSGSHFNPVHQSFLRIPRAQLRGDIGDGPHHERDAS